MIDTNTKLITIVGPTASGKTDLALELAKRFRGEIVCADSRTVYRGMDIGTAKPTPEEQARVPHHLLDVTSPDERLSAGEFKRLAENAISDIHARGNIALLVGGSGLYVDAVVFDYQFPQATSDIRRRELEAMNDADLQQLLQQTDAKAYKVVDLANRRRVIRALETAGFERQRLEAVPDNIFMLGLSLNKESMQHRIRNRIEKMLEQGFIDEVKRIGGRYGYDSEAFTGIGYRAFRDVVLNDKTVAAATDEFVHGDMMLVKKQLTWFKRNPAIHWLDNPLQAGGMVEAFLAPSS